MLDGLRAFGRYVPRTLVTRLVKEGRVGAGTEERELAIMFTDIVGFTAAREKLTAREVAEYINHHLASSPPASNRRAAPSTSLSGMP